MNIKHYPLALLWFFITTAAAQPNFAINECYQLARENYPLIKQKELLVKSKEFSIGNARTGFLPQLSIIGQATYQSDVTKIPIEVPGVKPLPKDQYRIYAEINQSLYDGGAVRHQTAIQETNALLEDQKVEVELYKIKDRVNQIYFGVLLMDEQLRQLELVKNDIQSSIQKTASAIRNGTAFKTNADILQAEFLKTEQREIELKATKRAYLEMLGIFINQTLSESTLLQRPSPLESAAEDVITRPELTLYTYQSQLYTAQQQLNNTKILPRLGLFVQGGYGRPGLNMLNSEFATYYLGGLRLNWNLSGLYNSKRDKEQLNLNLQGVNYQKEAFLFNTNLSLRQQKSEIVKLQELITVDEQIIELRARIKSTAKAQLDNGVITANDYLRELNAEDQARQNLSLHQIQFLMNQYNYQVTTGEGNLKSVH